MTPADGMSPVVEEADPMERIIDTTLGSGSELAQQQERQQSSNETTAMRATTVPAIAILNVQSVESPAILASATNARSATETEYSSGNPIGLRLTK